MPGSPEPVAQLEKQDVCRGRSGQQGDIEARGLALHEVDLRCLGARVDDV